MTSSCNITTKMQTHFKRGDAKLTQIDAKPLQTDTDQRQEKPQGIEQGNGREQGLDKNGLFH